MMESLLSRYAMGGRQFRSFTRTLERGSILMDKAYTELCTLNDAAHEESMRVLLDAGDVIGYTKAGKAIHLVGGGAAVNIAAWLPEEWTGPVITRVRQLSAVEALARSEPMSTLTKHIPRSGEVGVSTVAKSSAYGEDESSNDQVLLTARKVGRALRFAEEDLADSAQLVNVIDQKKTDWSTSYAKFMDNATLAVTAVENGTTVPFTSLYKALRTTNSATAYTADDNYTALASGATGTEIYDVLSNSLGDVETSDYFEDGSMVVIAHPTWRAKMRNVKDAQGRPIFVAGSKGTSGGDGGTPDTLFEIPIKWSLGAKTSAVATDKPTGNPLLIYVNKNYIVLGKRSGPESYTADPNSGAAFMTDEALVKMRARRAFAVAHEKAAAIVEG